MILVARYLCSSFVSFVVLLADFFSPYAASKASSDLLVRSYFHTYGFPAITTNCSNNYGPFQFPEKLIPLMTVNALAGKPLPIYGDGQQVRDWLYVDDHCAAISRAISAGKLGSTYNVGGNNEMPNMDIVHFIATCWTNSRHDWTPKATTSKSSSSKTAPGTTADTPSTPAESKTNSDGLRANHSPRESVRQSNGT